MRIYCPVLLKGEKKNLLRDIKLIDDADSAIASKYGPKMFLQKKKKKKKKVLTSLTLSTSTYLICNKGFVLIFSLYKYIQ